MTEAKAITCPICENICSSKAATCPKCGHPIGERAVVNKPVEPDGGTRKDSSRTALRILWVLFIISLFAAAVAITTYSNMPYELSLDGPVTRAERQWKIMSIVLRLVIPPILGLILLVVYVLRGKR